MPLAVSHRLIMASDDISQLADALAKTHVGDGELSYKGLGRKLDDADSGQVLNKTQEPTFFSPCRLFH